LMPTTDGTETVDDGIPERPRNDPVQVAALGAVTVGMLMLATSMGLSFGAALLSPMLLAALGTALLVGRSGRSIDELIGELVRRERGLPRRADSDTPDPAAV